MSVPLPGQQIEASDSTATRRYAAVVETLGWGLWMCFGIVVAIIVVTVAIGVAAAVIDIGRTRRDRRHR